MLGYVAGIGVPIWNSPEEIVSSYWRLEFGLPLIPIFIQTMSFLLVFKSEDPEFLKST